MSATTASPSHDYVHARRCKSPELAKRDRRLAFGVDDAEFHTERRPTAGEGDVRVGGREPKRHPARAAE
ncbi:MAG: hypothetical protein E6G25_06265 [Actinobacteria bacterium]|nr:MAG: hypothetical protein E6G25_06265 [Actinomycetota bacterium]